MSNKSESTPAVPEEMIRFYQEQYAEEGRLSEGVFQLEMARTEEFFQRYLPQPPAVVYDVGGGPGVYACRLALRGYEVHLVDPVPRHLAQAQEASDRQADFPIAGFELGSAARLSRPEESVDAVLLLGPLYHLPERRDRLQALREAHRVLKTGGMLLAAAISRYASVLGGLFEGILSDPEFSAIVQRDLQDGRHYNPTEKPQYFTTGYFHLPDELGAELCTAGFAHEATLAVEGPGWLLADFNRRWEDPQRREILLEAVRQLETAPSMLGVSAHLLAVGRK